MKKILKSIVLSFSISLVLFFVLSILLSLTQLKEIYINPLTIGISAFSIFVRRV